MITRRDAAAGFAASFLHLTLPRASFGESGLAALPDAFARIEESSGGRLGVAVLDTQNDARAEHRGAERFPMCSTFKVLAAACVLAKVDAGSASLDQQIAIRSEDLVTYSPFTEKHVGDTVTLRALAAAALTLSDNTAGNLLLGRIGGPAGLTAYARSLGDGETRLDRIETALNEALPGDPRDTTTPAAMLGDLHRLLIGDALSAASRQQLIDWMLASKTGDARLRAGVPGWRVADKTGSGDRGTANDIGILWPPGRRPILVTAYLTGSSASKDARSAALAAVGRAIAASIKA